MKKLLVFSSLILLGLIAINRITNRNVDSKVIDNVKVFSATDNYTTKTFPMMKLIIEGMTDGADGDSYFYVCMNKNSIPCSDHF